MQDRPHWTERERAILDARTEALARRPESVHRAPSMPVVRVRLGPERYGIAAAAILAVAPLHTLARVPHGPPELAGLVVRGGEIVPVFDLRVLLGLPLTSLPERARIVLLDDSSPVALLVDAVEETRSVGLRPLGPEDAALAPGVRALIAGFDDEGVPVLATRALLASDKLVVEVVPRLEDL